MDISILRLKSASPVFWCGFRAARPASQFFRPVILGWAAALLMLASVSRPALAADDYTLSPGDVIKIVVFKNPELSIDSQVSDSGTISYPLIGTVMLKGLTLVGAEQKIAQMLRDGGFVANPQVNIQLTLAVGNQVDVLGEVNKPGRYPIEGGGGKLTGVLAEAGGIAPTGSDTVIVTGTRNGQPFRKEIDVVALSQGVKGVEDLPLKGGDTLFVNHAPMFYIYGQVQRPGGYRVEKDMTVIQAIADGGGITGKGTTRGIVLRRKDARGKMTESKVSLDTEVKDQDVIDVKESMF
jgi:polysaccharide export outer membrane protein